MGVKPGTLARLQEIDPYTGEFREHRLYSIDLKKKKKGFIIWEG